LADESAAPETDPESPLAKYIRSHPEVAVAWATTDSRGADEQFRLCDSESRFEIGSITKLFTAILLCEAADEGLCDLDSPLAEYVPKHAPKLLGRAITLRQLANHTSSLPRLPLAMQLIKSSEQPYAAWDRERVLSALSQTCVLRPPGRLYAYSNFGYAVLGLVLETLRNSTYEDVVGDLTRRLGCPEIRLPKETDREKTVAGHGSRGRQVAPWTMAAFAPAGGLTSTLGGLTAFARRALSPLDAPGLAESMAERTTVKRSAANPKGVSVAVGSSALASAVAYGLQDSTFAPILAIGAAALAGGPLSGVVPTIAWVTGSTAGHEPISVVGQRLGIGLVATGIAQSLRKNTNAFEMAVGWHVSSAPKRQDMLWHNGGTAGFRSFLGLVPAEGRASVVLAASSDSVDPVGISLVRLR
jgi:CubicO group peptidase (beta-lactamase class C family)